MTLAHWTDALILGAQTSAKYPVSASIMWRASNCCILASVVRTRVLAREIDEERVRREAHLQLQSRRELACPMPPPPHLHDSTKTPAINTWCSATSLNANFNRTFSFRISNTGVICVMQTSTKLFLSESQIQVSYVSSCAGVALPWTQVTQKL